MNNSEFTAFVWQKLWTLCREAQQSVSPKDYIFVSDFQSKAYQKEQEIVLLSVKIEKAHIEKCK